MDAIRGLCKLDAETGLLAPGGLRVHKDERRECRACQPRVDRMRVDRPGATDVEDEDSGIQAERRWPLREVSPRYTPLIAQLLQDLGRAGIELAPHPTDAGRLRHRPADLPPDLSARLLIERAAVLRLLVDGYSPASDTDAGYVLGERLGVAEGLGMPTHPGSAAWLVAVGESMEAIQ